MYKKFYPEEPEEKAKQFANSLPEHKISMAKLQGHFLQNKNQPQKALASAESLLDIEYQIKDMSINEWLRRQNLHRFATGFKKQGILRVSDLRTIDVKALAE